ncbi:phage baseplate protein, partial [Klebsiella pneumoniae]|nr:phage baseplate protein [Klebsiella pneumoniae]
MNLRDGVPEGALEPSRISEAISLATGEYSHVLVSPTDKVLIAKGEIGVVGDFTWT